MILLIGNEERTIRWNQTEIHQQSIGAKRRVLQESFHEDDKLRFLASLLKRRAIKWNWILARQEKSVPSDGAEGFYYSFRDQNLIRAEESERAGSG